MTGDQDVERLRRRGRLQTAFASLGAALALLAVLVPAWIERVTPLRPDGGNGEAEWLLAVAFGLFSMVCGALRLRTRQRMALARVRVRRSGGRG